MDRGVDGRGEVCGGWPEGCDGGNGRLWWQVEGVLDLTARDRSVPWKGLPEVGRDAPACRWSAAALFLGVGAAVRSPLCQTRRLCRRWPAMVRTLLRAR